MSKDSKSQKKHIRGHSLTTLTRESGYVVQKYLVLVNSHDFKVKNVNVNRLIGVNFQRSLFRWS